MDNVVCLTATQLPSHPIRFNRDKLRARDYIELITILQHPANAAAADEVFLHTHIDTYVNNSFSGGFHKDTVTIERKSFAE